MGTWKHLVLGICFGIFSASALADIWELKGLNQWVEAGRDESDAPAMITETPQPSSAAASGFSATFITAQKLMSQDKFREAMPLLEAATSKEADPRRKGLIEFAHGIAAYQVGSFAMASDSLQQALKLPTGLSEYVQYYLALSRRREGDADGSRKAWQQVLNGKLPAVTQWEARLELAEVQLAQKSYRSAYNDLRGLQRRLKASPEYPHWLFLMLSAEQGLSRRGGCRWARELYAKYPGYPDIQNWGIDLASNKIGDKAIGCAASAKDIQSRMRHLQWAGEAQRAEQELQQLRARWGDGYSVDNLLAGLLVNDGDPEMALKLLLKHFDENKGNPGFMLLLAKALARVEDQGAAAAAYNRAYELAPRGKQARNALFSAAFTAYQMQDYDGAAQKFTQFLKLGGKNQQLREAQWYLAWIRYLRQDYQAAYQQFAKMSVLPRISRRQRRRGADTYAVERFRYWQAVTLNKLGQGKEAAKLFRQLAGDPALGYYAVLATYRLQEMVAQSAELRSEIGSLNKTSLAEQLSEEELQTAAQEASQETAPPNDDRSAEASDEEEEDSVAENGDSASDAEEIAGDFRKPVLMQRLERARTLNLLGLEEHARRELVELERGTRSAADKRTLMAQYVLLGQFHRASYIGETYFGVQRLRGGMQGSRALWEFAFPRAFDGAVSTQAREFAVPEEFVWSIMRTESQYRPRATSAVGALGLMQLMPVTGRQVAELLKAKDFRTHDLLLPDTNIRYGTRYLRRLLDMFQDKVPLVAAGYNAGPHRVQAWLKGFGHLGMDEFIEHIPFLETRNYVKKVVRNMQIYSLLYNARNARQFVWLIHPVGVKANGALSPKDLW